jgi:hypothetical protein
MAWEPIEITEEDVRAFAGQADTFCSSLDERGKAMFRHIVGRAAGDVAGGADGGTTLDQMAHMLEGVWEPGTTIAPLYSGDMPRTGGGTVD